MTKQGQYSLTILFGQPERFNIHRTVEVLNHLGQLSVHFLNLLRVDRPTNRSRCDCQHLPTPKKTAYYL